MDDWVRRRGETHMNSRNHARQLITFIGVLIIAGIVFVSWHQWAATHADDQAAANSGDSRDAGSRMTKYVKEGRYDDAIHIGLGSLRNQPSDEFFYNQIAVVYFVRAEKDRDRREQWVASAVSYTEQALALNSKSKDVAGILLFQEGRSFGLAGDLSSMKRCTHYGRALFLIQQREGLLQGKQVTVDGTAYPLAPMRKENEKILMDIKAKAANAGCK
jgi:hypothetical protein